MQRIRLHNDAIHGHTAYALQVNNAGVLASTHSTSKQGHELSFATNHLGPFLLTQLLLPYIKSPGETCTQTSHVAVTLMKHLL